jgi:hypothetical protein
MPASYNTNRCFPRFPAPQSERSHTMFRSTSVRVPAALLGLTLLLTGCSTLPLVPLVYEPASGGLVQPYYVMGAPYAALSGDCAELRVGLSPVTLDGQEYVRAFVSWHNRSADPFELLPLQAFELEIQGDGTRMSTGPAAPQTILRAMEIRSNTEGFLQALGAGVEAAAVQPTAIQGTATRLDDRAEKQERILDRAADRIGHGQAHAHDSASGFAATVLRRHTLYPGTAAMGFVYFPAPGQIAPLKPGKAPLDAFLAGQRFALTVHTPCGDQTLHFTPARGE